MVELHVEDYQCPVCMEAMLGQIMQCREGHIICQSCVDAMTAPRKCPTCREDYPDGRPVRARVLEEVVGRIPIPCKHGCGFTAKASEMIGHLPVCRQRRTTCPVSDCTDVVPLCDLERHYQEKHAACLSRGDEKQYHMGKISKLDELAG